MNEWNKKIKNKINKIDRRFADDFFKCIFMNKRFCVSNFFEDCS